MNLWSWDIKTMEKITALDFNAKPVPVELFRQMKGLKKLTIKGAQFEELKLASECDNVEEIKFYGTPKGALKLKALKNLTIIDEHRTQIFDQTFSFTECKLQMLHVETKYNAIKNLSVPTSLTRITIINAGHTEIDFSSSKHLIELTLSRTYKFKLPQNAPLTKLKINNCELGAVPDEIKTFASLEELDLLSNKIAIVPSFVFTLKKLTTVNLYSNAIVQIQDCAVNTSSIKTIKIGYNKLTYLPDFIYRLKLLEELHAESNMLTSVLGGINSQSDLKRINFGHNLITNISDVFRYLPLLNTLSLNNNYISVFPNINQLISLANLNISSNFITELPEIITCPLNSMQYDVDKIKNVKIKKGEKYYNFNAYGSIYQLPNPMAVPTPIPASNSSTPKNPSVPVATTPVKKPSTQATQQPTPVSTPPPAPLPAIPPLAPPPLEVFVFRSP